MGRTGQQRFVIGAMSGTSADGVDVALVEIDGAGTGMRARLVAHHYKPYDAALRQRIFDFREPAAVITLCELAKLAGSISRVHAQAASECLAAQKLNPAQIVAIAAHGQTLFHDPPGTIQWLDPALLAAETGCTVVSDFRRADCAAGGQGAPLVPFADYVLFRDRAKSRAMLNIGGIANVTFLKAAGSIEDVIAFDTGPGNCLCDWACREFAPHGVAFDADGAGASRGRVLHDVAQRFCTNEYFAKLPPKSTDGPSMISAFEGAIRRGSRRPDAEKLDDLLATAAYVCAKTVCDALKTLPGRVDQVLVSGGGVRNAAIMRWIGSLLGPDVQLGECPDSQAKEAIAFALLGAATLDGIPANVPSATGARRAVVLGSVTPKP